MTAVLALWLIHGALIAAVPVVAVWAWRHFLTEGRRNEKIH